MNLIRRFLSLSAVAAIGLLTGCAQFATPRETVLQPGQRLTFKTETGPVEVAALSDRVREIRWDGISRRITCVAHQKRWYGALGIYHPHEHIEPHKGISRVLYGEAQQSFESERAAFDWLHLPYNSRFYRYDRHGLAFGWLFTPEREQLAIKVTQITIKGRPATDLPGATLQH